MANEFYKHNGTAFQLMTEIAYQDGATLRNITEVHYKDVNTWRQVFATTIVGAVSLDDFTISSTRNTALGVGTVTAGYVLSTGGIAIDRENNGINSDALVDSDLSGDNWWTLKPIVGIGTSYQVMVTVSATNGIGSLSGTIGVWTTITSEQSWLLTDTGNNVNRVATREIFVQIRDVATSTVQDDATIALTGNLIN